MYRSSRRFVRQAEDERHHGFALCRVERELRHAEPLVVALGARRFVVEAPRHPQLLPQEAVPLVAVERLQEVARVGVELVVERINAVAVASCSSSRASPAIRRVRPCGPRPPHDRARVRRMRRRPARRHEFAVRRQELADVLERELGRILAAPAGQRRADRLGRFVARNVVAAEAAVAAERTAGHVLELPLRAIGVVLELADQNLLVDLDRGREPLAECRPWRIARPACAGTTR